MGLEVLLVHLARLQLLERLLRLVVLRLMLLDGPSPAETSESVGWQNFGRMLLVFGCIGTDFCNKICVLQHFSKSTRFSS